MPPTTVTYLVTRSAPGAESYRAVIEITGTTNDLDRELFVFETYGGLYVSVATRMTLEQVPRTQQEAADLHYPYFRGTTVQRDYPNVEGADAFIAQTLTRLTALCKSIDKVAMPFGGTEAGTLPVD